MSKKLINFVIMEGENNWKQLFLTGQKGLPKTNQETLDFIESLLMELYDSDQVKVEKSKIKIWMVKVINQIGGPSNLDTNDFTKLKKVLEWFKINANYDQIKDLDIENAYLIAIKFFEKKDKETRKPSAEINSEEIQVLEDERAGKIKRLHVLNDGSRRMWVQVLKPSWFSETCFRGMYKGVKCQSTTDGKYAKPPYISYTLIGPSKDDLTSPYSTLGSISILSTENSIAEIKQENNQHPGSQSTSTGWDDLGEQFVKFICFSPEMKSKINKFSSDSGAVGVVGDGTTYGGTATFNWWMNNKPEYINMLAKYRFDIIDNNKVNILNNKNFGKNWFALREVDLAQMAKDNPIQLISQIETLSNVFGAELTKVLKTIDIPKLASFNKKLVYSALPTLTEHIDNNVFFEVLESVDYLSGEYSEENFERSIRIVSNRKGKEQIKYLINKDFNKLINNYGNEKAVGLNNLLEFLSTPQSTEMFEKSTKIGPKRYRSFRNERTPEGGTVKVDFEVEEDKKILSQKDRRDILKAHKNEIESWYKMDGASNPEIEYLRLLFTEYNLQDIKREVEDKKESFISHYDKKYLTYSEEKKNGVKIKTTAQKKPGILEFYSLVSKYDPNYKINSILLDDKFPDSTYPMDAVDFMKNLKTLYQYYRDNSNFSSNSKIASTSYVNRVYYAFKAIVQTAEDSNVAPSDIEKIIFTLSKPSVVFKNNSDYINKESYILYFNLVYYYFDNDKNKTKQILTNMKDEIEDAQNGKIIFNELLKKYSLKGYNIKIGDMLQYKGDSDYNEGLLHLKMYKIGDLGNDGDVINGLIYVLNDKGGKSLVHPTQFKNVKEQLLNESNEGLLNYIRNKIKEKYKTTLNERASKFVYSAIKLDRESRKKLQSIIPDLVDQFDITEDIDRWIQLADHVTINTGELYDKNLLDEIAVVTLKSIGFNDRVIAVGVDVDVAINFKDRKPHITLLFNKEAGAKPVESNYIKNWIELPSDLQIELYGSIKEMGNG